MPIDLNDLTLEKSETSPEEVARLEAPAEQPCSGCGGPMNVGEEEAVGICSDCYWKAINHPQL